jgi:transposase InsO family protein
MTEMTWEGLVIKADGRPPLRPRDRCAVAADQRARAASLHLRSDNRPQFVSRAVLRWIVDHGIDTALIDPGKPWQNWQPAVAM